MWWDVERDCNCVDLTGDPTAVVDERLLESIAALDWDDLRIVEFHLRQLENYISSLPHLLFVDATIEDEAPFVDRPIAGEVVLVDPDRDDPSAFATALLQQILAVPVRWQQDVYENLCALVEVRLAGEPRRERVRRWLLRNTFGIRFPRRRVLAMVRSARADNAWTNAGSSDAERFAAEFRSRLELIHPEMTMIDAGIEHIPHGNAVVTFRFVDGTGQMRQEGYQLGPLAEVVGSDDPRRLARWAADRTEAELLPDDESA